MSPLNALAAQAPGILGRPLDLAELGLFRKYLDLLLKWQKSQRLVGSSDPRWIVERLFLDSLLFLRVLPARLDSLADVGSGAGIPGIPIKIVSPEIHVTLIESRSRRASFLAAVVRELRLERARVVTTRVEEHVTHDAARFDAVVMRCAGASGDLLGAAARLLNPGGAVVISGPPSPPPDGGDWNAVVGPTGSRRWFRVYRPSAEHPSV